MKTLMGKNFARFNSFCKKHSILPSDLNTEINKKRIALFYLTFNELQEKHGIKMKRPSFDQDGNLFALSCEHNVYSYDSILINSAATRFVYGICLRQDDKYLQRKAQVLREKCSGGTHEIAVNEISVEKIRDTAQKIAQTLFLERMKAYSL